MYGFTFYFYYGMLKKTDEDPVFTAKLGVFIVLWLHVMALLSITEHLLGARLPSFGESYATNKAWWYIPAIAVLIPVLYYFNKKRTDVIMAKYSAKENFFSLLNILLFLLIAGAPVFIMIKF